MDIFGATENQKIGITLTLIGLVFMFLGVILLLDSALLTMGNVMFIVGMVLTMGHARTKSFFFSRERARPSVFFFSGMYCNSPFNGSGPFSFPPPHRSVLRN